MAYKMMRKVGSMLAVNGFHQISKRGLALRKIEKPPKILITGWSDVLIKAFFKFLKFSDV